MPERRTYGIFLLLIFLTGVVSFTLGFDPRQVASITIFSTMIYGTLLFWRFRVGFALLAALAFLFLGLVDVKTLIEYAKLDVILFLIGMMIVIGFLEERKFFEYLIAKILRFVGPNAKLLLIVMMCLAGLFAALVDEVTSILFMVTTMLYLLSKYEISPVPFIIMLVFATNVGSSATVVGNPIGVFIAFEGGLTFMDFLRWATPVAVVVMLIVVPLSILYFSKDIKKLDEFMKGGRMELSIEIPRRDLIIAFMVFFGTIFFLVAHHTIEEIFHLAKNTMLLGTAIGAAGVSLLIDQERAREIVERKVDWWTLLFFLLFFASVGTLVYMNVTDRLASGLILLTGGNELFVLGIFGGVSGITTAFMDNVLAVATLSPVVHSLGEVGFFTFPFWWALLFGGTYFGNLTMIGSTANIVAIGMLERRKLGHITFSQWIKPGIIVSVPSLIAALFILYIQIPLMG